GKAAPAASPARHDPASGPGQRRRLRAASRVPFLPLSALAAIVGPMAWLRKVTFTPFVVYCMALAGILAAMLVLGWLSCT
ncbi:MAG: hypothetical protein ACK4RZ_11035, partial [Paracoccaceae bacterium]